MTSGKALARKQISSEGQLIVRHPFEAPVVPEGYRIPLVIENTFLIHLCLGHVSFVYRLYLVSYYTNHRNLCI